MARSVFMYVCFRESEAEKLSNEDESAHALSKEIVSYSTERNFLNAGGLLKKAAVNPI